MTTTINFAANGERGKKKVTVCLEGDRLHVAEGVTRIEFLEGEMVHFVGKVGAIIPQVQIVSIQYD